jgi:hypothetical protein
MQSSAALARSRQGTGQAAAAAHARHAAGPAVSTIAGTLPFGLIKQSACRIAGLAPTDSHFITVILKWNAPQPTAESGRPYGETETVR